MAHIILASSSPRRKELLHQVIKSFTIVVSEIDETFDESYLPEEIVMKLAREKALAVASQYPDAFVIGADTIVYHNGKILGKPKDEQEAKRMLTELSGGTHSVYTGVAIVRNGHIENFFEKTDVTFWELTDDEIEKYIQTGEPMDKAGSYGIQGAGAALVKTIRGDFYSVVGLPISKLLRTLTKLGFQEES